MGIFLLEMADGSEMILTAGRATRTESGDVAFEYVDARGNWSRSCTVQSTQVKTAYARRVGEDGMARWVPQLSTGRWWAY
ncbi:hypothetical protein [Streptomyces sp. TRM70350]|uniref:hypothetical protein n=1 Tax=Streptomyces sp. TRM70350 TaxID=2856165 RepID=UPI001C4533F6|nr:hypothetical protein [Streptomyces sp. TRM70350]MBV7697446.1 hypothetical protein [Streptomyces sp. TRM70350]